MLLENKFCKKYELEKKFTFIWCIKYANTKPVKLTNIELSAVCLRYFVLSVENMPQMKNFKFLNADKIVCW